MTKERYENLNGIRAYTCVGVVLKHVLANGNFSLRGFVFERLIPSFQFSMFFMLISAFAMCCGYYEQFKNGTVSLEQFYKRRYQRIWPFFALLCTVELIVTHNLNALYEWFADLTLAFGLIPNHEEISVVGVGWFLGTVFVFYMIFPFFVFLMKDKKRAWFVMAICVILHILCDVRFERAATGGNIIYSSIFFVAGGLIYLYRDTLTKLNKIWKSLIGTAAVAVLAVYYFTPGPLSKIVLCLFLSLSAIIVIPSGGVYRRYCCKTRLYVLWAV